MLRRRKIKARFQHSENCPAPITEGAQGEEKLFRKLDDNNFVVFRNIQFFLPIRKPKTFSTCLIAKLQNCKK